MPVFLTGATGHIGSAVLRALLTRGRDVVALVRDEEKAARIAAAGARPVVGDLADLDLLEHHLRAADGVVHTASPGDQDSARADAGIVDVAVRVLGGTPVPYVHTGGLWTFGTNRDVVETDPPRPLPITAWRVDVESRLRASTVRSTIVVPATVYGHGRGIPTVLDGEGEVRLVGDGSQHWATVHADDLADLYVRALDRAGEDEHVIGASGQNPTVRELAEAAAHGRPVVAETVEESRERLGALFADALLLDQRAAGRHARAAFGWNPSRPALVEQLAHGYATADARG